MTTIYRCGWCRTPTNKNGYSLSKEVFDFLNAMPGIWDRDGVVLMNGMDCCNAAFDYDERRRYPSRGS